MERGGDVQLVGPLAAETDVGGQRPGRQRCTVEYLTGRADAVEPVSATHISPPCPTAMPSGHPLANVQRTSPSAWRNDAVSYDSSCDDDVAVTMSREPSGVNPSPLMKTGPESSINSVAPLSVSTAQTHPRILSSGLKKSISPRVSVTQPSVRPEHQIVGRTHAVGHILHPAVSYHLDARFGRPAGSEHAAVLRDVHGAVRPDGQSVRSPHRCRCARPRRRTCQRYRRVRG